ncbi:MAG: hypothetical protein PWQ89_480 [Verrucomicrobiota bacterium]|jgi:hypothetical protein|nr:hypothetical protein [Verrucomicrobiota bacterium]
MRDEIDAMNEARMDIESDAIEGEIIEQFIQRLIHRRDNPKRLMFGYCWTSKITDLFNEQHRRMMEAEIDKVLKRLTDEETTEWDFELNEIPEIEHWLDWLEEEMEESFERFLEYKCRPLKRTTPEMKRELELRLEKRRKRYSQARRENWKEYPDFLNEYFKRNPTYKLTDGRRACAKKFDVTLRTIERRTKGYRKPRTKKLPTS